MAFVDVEAMLLPFLEDTFPETTFVTEVPADRPATFVRIWRNGGPSINRIVDRPLITVEAWAPAKALAAPLAGGVRDALLSASSAMPLVRGVTEITGPYSIPDPESGSPRYRFSVQLTVRAARR